MSVFDVFVQNPLLIALIAGLFFGAYLLLRANAALRSRALLIPATAWLAWAVWEWAIVQFSPQADIRVDLLLIVPLVLVLSVVGSAGLFWKRKG